MLGVALGAVVLLRAGRNRFGTDSVPAALGIVVEVRNGTDRRGLARQVTRLLREGGLDVISFGNAESPAARTEILVRRGPLSQGHEVARVLGAGIVRSAPDTLLRLDVTILIGADYQFPKGRVPL